jgi:hypothetical protein
LINERWGNKWGNTPHRLQPISAELDPAETALERAPLSPADLQAQSHNPKVAGSNPAPAIEKGPATQALSRALTPQSRFPKVLMRFYFLSAAARRSVGSAGPWRSRPTRVTAAPAVRVDDIHSRASPSMGRGGEPGSRRRVRLFQISALPAPPPPRRTDARNAPLLVPARLRAR